MKKCIDCEHWGEPIHTVTKGDGWKICGLLMEWDDKGNECVKTQLADLESGDYASSGAYLHTNKDFGCVEFKEKG